MKRTEFDSWDDLLMYVRQLTGKLGNQDIHIYQREEGRKWIVEHIRHGEVCVDTPVSPESPSN